MKKIKDILLRKADHTLWLFLGLWCCTAILYLPAFRGGFYEDFLGFMSAYRNLSFWEGTFRESTGLYYGYRIFMYLAIALFDLHPIPWFLLFTGLHAATAVSIQRFYKGLYRLWQAEYNRVALLTGILIWLLSPLAAEVINWKVCIHYMVSAIMLFEILKWCTDYLSAPRPLTLGKIFLTYILSFFFLEYFYLTPVFLTLLLAAIAYCRKPVRVRPAKAVIRILLPLTVLWLLYYLLLQWVTGRAVARVDSTSQLLDPTLVSVKVNKFLVHIYGMEYFLPAATKGSLYRFLEQNIVTLPISLLLIALTFYVLYRMRKAQPEQQLRAMIWLFLLASFIIILPMWFFELFPYQGSRYFYLAGAFGYPLLALFLLPGGKPAKFRYGIAGLYLCCNVAGTLYLVKNIRDAAKISNNLMDGFRWDHDDPVVLLNLPTLYRGIGIIGADAPSNFATHLEVLRQRKVNGHIYDVSSFNMDGRWDGAHVQVIDSMQLKVILNQYGTWWWFAGFGAYDYENELYTVRFAADGASYTIRFRQPPSSATLVLYQSGGDWKKVDWHKKEEQW